MNRALFWAFTDNVDKVRTKRLDVKTALNNVLGANEQP